MFILLNPNIASTKVAHLTLQQNTPHSISIHRNTFQLYAKQFIKLDIIGNNISGIVAGGKSEIMEAGRLQVVMSFFFSVAAKKKKQKENFENSNYFV